MKNIWQEFKSFIKMISKGKKDVAVVMAAGGFMKATVPFLAEPVHQFTDKLRQQKCCHAFHTCLIIPFDRIV